MNRSLWLVSAALVLMLVRASAGEDKVSARAFAGDDGLLNAEEASLYIAYRDNEPLAKFLTPGERQLDMEKLKAAMADKVDDLRRIGHAEPWTWQELDGVQATEPDKPAWQQIPGVTVERKWQGKRTSGSRGPIRLRGGATEINKSSQEAKGLTVGFSNNRLVAGRGVWNTEGALFYPVKVRWEQSTASRELEAGPLVAWKLVQTEEKGKQEIEEVTYSVPFTFYVSPSGQPTSGGISSALWVMQASPYYQTDFSGGHQIRGTEASAEFIGGAFGTGLYVGGYQNLSKSGLLQYQLRFIPKLDRSDVRKTGPHSSRKLNDDWFRAGATVSFDLRLGGVSVNPLVLGVSYQFLQEFSGEENYADLFKAKTTWWLSPNAGLTLEYSDGETPVAAKQVDLLSISLELKY